MCLPCLGCLPSDAGMSTLRLPSASPWVSTLALVSPACPKCAYTVFGCFTNTPGVCVLTWGICLPPTRALLPCEVSLLNQTRLHKTEMSPTSQDVTLMWAVLSFPQLCVRRHGMCPYHSVSALTWDNSTYIRGVYADGADLPNSLLVSPRPGITP